MNLFVEIMGAWLAKLMSGSGYVMTLWLMIICKHLIVDFLWQGPYQYKNKGTYGHPGGILHAGLHTITTFGILLTFCVSSWTTLLALALFEGVTHYHIDWFKMNLNKKKGWGPTTHEEFWYLLGADQFAHFIIYWLVIGSAL